VSREIPWNWYRPGPERDAARARDKQRRQAMGEAARKRAVSERRPVAKTERDAEIRRLWLAGWMGVTLAKRFVLSKASVSGIVAGLPRPRRYGDPEDASWPHPRRHAPGGIRHQRRPPIEAVGTLPPRELAPKGSAHGRAKLDEAKVGRMKRLRMEGWTTGRLAKEFGVGRNTVCYVLNGTTWSHVDPAPPTNGGTA
jgi:hypothetical protein